MIWEKGTSRSSVLLVVFAKAIKSIWDISVGGPSRDDVGSRVEAWGSSRNWSDSDTSVLIQVLLGTCGATRPLIAPCMRTLESSVVLVTSLRTRSDCEDRYSPRTSRVRVAQAQKDLMCPIRHFKWILISSTAWFYSALTSNERLINEQWETWYWNVESGVCRKVDKRTSPKNRTRKILWTTVTFMSSSALLEIGVRGYLQAYGCGNRRPWLCQ